MNGIIPWRGGYAYPSLASISPFKQETVAPVPSQQQQSSLRDWWKELRGETVQAPTATESAIMGLRFNAEGAAMGAILALIDTELGGLDMGGRIPLDGVGAALFYVLSIRDSGKPEGIAPDFRAFSQSCTTVAFYRMVHKWREAKKGIPRNTPTLTAGDPILTTGKDF